MAEEFMAPLARQGLHLYGIEEVEWNVCEDNIDNRRILANAGIRFKVLDVGLLEVDFMSDEEVTEKNKKRHADRKSILKNPKDPWGDYIDFDTLPIEYMESAPAFIQRRLNDWDEYQDKLSRGEKVKKELHLPVRCVRRRADGSRCWNWSWPVPNRKDMCRGHLKPDDFDVIAQTEKIKRVAKMRFNQITPAAIDALEDLIVNSPIPQVRHSAIKTLLELNGFKPGLEISVSGTVEHEVKDPAAAVRERLAGIAARRELQSPSEPDTIIEAEIISDTPEPEEVQNVNPKSKYPESPF